MRKPTTIVRILFSLSIVLAFVTACGPAETITESFTEAEFNQEEFLCQDFGLVVDFTPGKMVCTGEIEGKQVVVEIIAEVVDGTGRFKIINFFEDGVRLAPEEFAHLNVELAADAYLAEEGYAMTTIIITDDNLTITSNLK